MRLFFIRLGAFRATPNLSAKQEVDSSLPIEDMEAEERKAGQVAINSWFSQGSKEVALWTECARSAIPCTGCEMCGAPCRVLAYEEGMKNTLLQHLNLASQQWQIHKLLPSEIDCCNAWAGLTLPSHLCQQASIVSLVTSTHRTRRGECH